MESKWLVTNGFSVALDSPWLATWTTDPARKPADPPLYIVIATIIILSRDRLVGGTWSADLLRCDQVGLLHFPFVMKIQNT